MNDSKGMIEGRRLPRKSTNLGKFPCMTSTESATYTKTAKILHWLIAVMIILMLALGWGFDFFSGETKRNWRRAWKRTVAEFYMELVPESPDLSEKDLKKWGSGGYPSYQQFRYWTRLLDDYEALTRKLDGDRAFELLNRRRRKKTSSNAKGPGAVYITDATPLDWHLVHQVTRRPLSKDAKLYLVVDAFSHLIVGFYLHLGPENIEAVSMALLSAAEDKVELCERYGILIVAKQWPSACLPTRLAEDGAGASYRHGALVVRGVIRGLTIVPAYRPDLKGLVEAYNSAFASLSESIPGHAKGPKQRGERDPVAEACLDYYQSVRIIIKWILDENRRVLKDYQMLLEMIADGVLPTPIDIWNWGCANLGGLRRTWATEELLKICLPTERAQMTRDGLEFRSCVYEPVPGNLPQFSNWCALASANGGWPVTVSYRPDKFSDLFYHDGDVLVRMQLAPRSGQYTNWTEAEFEGYKASMKQIIAERNAENEVYSIKTESDIGHIVDEGRKATQAARGTPARRRLDKSDRPANSADQRKLNAASFRGARQQTEIRALNDLQLEDEDEIAAAIRGNS